MRRKPIVCLRSVAVVMLLLWTLMLGVNAEEAYTSWDTLNGKVSVYGRHMFEASRRISGTSLGLDFSLKGLEDIFCANDDKVYLLAGSEAAVVILDSDLNLESVVTCENQRIFRMPWHLCGYGWTYLYCGYRTGKDSYTGQRRCGSQDFGITGF